MKIAPNYIGYNNRVSVPYRKVQTCDTVCFSGHSMIENYSKKGIGILIHQTALGRELKTKFFVRDYVEDLLKTKNRVNIISGGCSTGEEADTYSMLLHGDKDKVSILGIDIGKKAIKQANSRRVVFEVPKNGTNILEHFESIDASPYTDLYLLSSKNSGLSAEQSYFKRLFKELMEPTGRKIRTPFWEWLHNNCEKRNGLNPLELDRIEYKLKDGVGENCRFVQGDIRDIDKITNGEKADVISFSNALYHLTTYQDEIEGRVKYGNRYEIAKELMSKFKDTLRDGGIVVFGEDEGSQLLDAQMIPEVMKKLGFQPLNKTELHDANVWKKVQG